MRDSYLQSLTKLSSAKKAELNAIYNAALLATQQTYLESSITDNKVSFDVLEGKVKYDKTSEIGIFYPNKHLKALLENVDLKGKAVLLEKTLSRFTALMVHAYKDFNESLENPYKTWLQEGYTGNETDFINWIVEKSHEEKNQKTKPNNT